MIMPTSAKPTPPASGQKIALSGQKLQVPDQPIIPFIEGDGTGRDIWRASVRVFDAAVARRPTAASARSTGWKSTPARRPTRPSTPGCRTRPSTACRDYLVSIKGPLTTPVGGGIRSLNVALRQLLDLYVCLRPVRWFKGVPSPVKTPEKVDMVIFRENTEDIYAGIEFEAGSTDSQEIPGLFKQNFPKQYAKIRFPDSSGIGIKPVSREGTERLFRAAIEYAIANKRKSVTIVHKGNIMKFTEGAFRNWCYALAEREFAAAGLSPGNSGNAPRPPRARRKRTREMDAARKAGKVIDQGRDRGHHAAAGADPSGRIRRDRHHESQRRLPVGRAGRAGGRHRHRARRQHQLHDRPRGVRSHARHRAEVRRSRQGQSGFGDPVGRNDAALHGLDSKPRTPSSAPWTRRSPRRP